MTEQSFEGVANGHLNGSATNPINRSLLDSPIDESSLARRSPNLLPVLNGLFRHNLKHHVHTYSHTQNNIWKTLGTLKKTHSSSAVASQLFYSQRTSGSAPGSGGSRRSSFNSDIENMSVSDAEVHSEISEIHSQVRH